MRTRWQDTAVGENVHPSWHFAPQVPDCDEGAKRRVSNRNALSSADDDKIPCVPYYRTVAAWRELIFHQIICYSAGVNCPALADDGFGGVQLNCKSPPAISIAVTLVTCQSISDDYF